MTKRYIVASDSHKNIRRLIEIMERHPDAEALLFLGDVVKDAEDIEDLYPDRIVISVRGNCDIFSEIPTVRIVPTIGGTVFMTHGHEFGASEGLIAKAARDNGAKVALFGHTHKSICRYEDGLWLINPGSISQPRDDHPSYAIVDVTDKGITAHIVKFDF